MKLSDAACRNAKPGTEPYTLADGLGLSLTVTPGGGKLWRMRCRFGGKARLLALGQYPDVSLLKARERRDEARRQLADGIDPAAVKRARKQATREAAENSFEVIGREWFARASANWVPGYSKRVLALAENDLYPRMGARPIHEITAPELLAVLRKIESRGVVETTHRCKQIAAKVFSFAIITGRCAQNPAIDMQQALTPMKGDHFAALTDPVAVGGLLRALDCYDGSPIVKSALRLLPYVFVRPGELRQAQWADVDFEAGQWAYTATKTTTPHIVPLSRQALAILNDLRPLTGHRGAYVFPGDRTHTRPMSDNALGAALRRMAFTGEATAHGWRATARTLLDEALGYPPHLIEHQLAHSVRDQMGRAYNRTAHLPERKIMMQRWADYLDELRAGAEIIRLRS